MLFLMNYCLVENMYSIRGQEIGACPGYIITKQLIQQFRLFWSQMQQSFNSLEIIYCLYVGFEAEEMVVVANLQVDPQQKTL